MNVEEVFKVVHLAAEESDVQVLFSQETAPPAVCMGVSPPNPHGAAFVVSVLQPDTVMLDIGVGLTAEWLIRSTEHYSKTLKHIQLISKAIFKGSLKERVYRLSNETYFVIGVVKAPTKTYRFRHLLSATAINAALLRSPLAADAQLLVGPSSYVSYPKRLKPS